MSLTILAGWNVISLQVNQQGSHTGATVYSADETSNCQGSAKTLGNVMSSYYTDDDSYFFCLGNELT